MKRVLAKLLFVVMLITLALSPAALMEETDMPAEAVIAPAEAMDAAPVETEAEEPVVDAVEEPIEDGGAEAAAEPEVELVPDAVEPEVDEVSFDLVEEEYALEPTEEEAVSTPAMFGSDEDLNEIDVTTTFPDEVLQHIILDKEIDQNQNGKLSRLEIEAVTEIPIAYEVTDGEHTVQLVAERLMGLNIFPNLDNLNCMGVKVDGIILTLDIRGCENLGNIDLYDSTITSLTIITDREGLNLPCRGCNIGTLTIDGGADLEDLWIEGDIYIDADDENGDNLFEAEDDDQDRPVITSVDVSACTGLKSLICKETQTETVNFSGCNQLVRLDCTGNYLSAVDITGKTALEELHICGNDENKQLSLDLSQCGNLRVLKCEGSKISALDVSNCPSLVYLLENVPAKTEIDDDLTVYALSDGEWERYRLSFTGEVALTPEPDPDLPSPVAINETNFPNANFRQYIMNRFGKAENESLSSDEIAFTTEITLCPEKEGYEGPGDRWLTNEDGSPKGMGITSIKGIEVFKNLQVLNCLGNALNETLDLSNFKMLTELNCSDCGLSRLDVSHNPNLETLACPGNSLTELNLANNTRLSFLIVDHTDITTLDVRACKALSDIIDPDRREFATNDDTEEIEFMAFHNYRGPDAMLFCSPYITLVGKETLPALNPIVSVSLESIPDKIFREYLSDNYDGLRDDYNGRDYSKKDGKLSPREIIEIDNIDLHAEPDYTPLGVTNLSGIENFQFLIRLECGGNAIKSLDPSPFRNLRFLHCYLCQLTSLNVTNNPRLVELDCQVNNISALDISKNAMLSSLNCHTNNITELDISHCRIWSKRPIWPTRRPGATISLKTELNTISSVMITWCRSSGRMMKAKRTTRITASPMTPASRSRA